MSRHNLLRKWIWQVYVLAETFWKVDRILLTNLTLKIQLITSQWQQIFSSFLVAQPRMHGTLIVSKKCTSSSYINCIPKSCIIDARSWHGFPNIVRRDNVMRIPEWSLSACRIWCCRFQNYNFMKYHSDLWLPVVRGLLTQRCLFRFPTTRRCNKAEYIKMTHCSY